MYKKLVTLLMTACFCFVLTAPVVKAAEIKSMEVTADGQPSQDEIQKKSQELYQKWTALSKKQKNDIYKSVKGTIDAQAKFLDKLVKYDLMTEDEAKAVKDDMYARFEEMKANDALFQGQGSSSEAQSSNDTKKLEENPTQAPVQ